MAAIKVNEGDPTSEQYTPPYVKFYSHATPNGNKVRVLVKLLGIDVHSRAVNIRTNEHKEPWYLELNPNGRVPTITDVDEEGNIYPVMESAVILQYLSDKFDTERKFSYGADAGHLYWDQQQWLTYSVASCGPYFGQYFWFTTYAPDKIPYAIERYRNESLRVLDVMNKRLEKNGGWLVGDHLNIADISAFGWIAILDRMGVVLSRDFPAMGKWFDTIITMPGVAESMTLD